MMSKLGIMNEAEFLERFAEALGIPAEGFTMETRFQEEPTFDSVAVLSLMVLMDELGKSIQGPVIRKCQTPGELWALA
jgi:acyl carrier protein